MKRKLIQIFCHIQFILNRCCKMHDWCYTTTTCHGLEWDLPYFVPFKWKCNGGSPYCSKLKCIVYVHFYTFIKKQMLSQ